MDEGFESRYPKGGTCEGSEEGLVDLGALFSFSLHKPFSLDSFLVERRTSRVLLKITLFRRTQSPIL